MVKIMLDTNICIYAMKKRPESVFKRLSRYKPEEVSISAITFAELQYRIEKSQKREGNQNLLLQFLAPLEILDWPQQATANYGKIREKREVIGSLDMLIASLAQYSGVSLVTNNIRKFRRIPDLMLENWGGN